MVRFIPAGLHGNAGVFGAIAGGSRSGKTLTALRIARGIAGPTGRICAIDTEGGRMSHYAQPPSLPEIPGEKYHFDEYRMKSPFSPEIFADLLNDAEADGAAVSVVDSFSLEWMGLGGVIDLHDNELRRLVEAARIQAEANGETLRPGAERRFGDAAWAFAKRPHKLMRDRLLQSSMPVIFCIRSNEVPKHLAKGREGTWKAEQDKRFIYEWTFALTLHPSNPGQPRYDLKTPEGEDAFKMPPFFLPFFPEGKFITEEAGAQIAAWRCSHGTSLKRTVRDIVRDRCASAESEEDMLAIEALDSFKTAMDKAPDEIKTELRTMVSEARTRIEQERKRSSGTAADRAEDDGGSTGNTEPEDSADDTAAKDLIDLFDACKTDAQVLELAKARFDQVKDFEQRCPDLYAKIIAAIDARRVALGVDIKAPAKGKATKPAEEKVGELSL